MRKAKLGLSFDHCIPNRHLASWHVAFVAYPADYKSSGVMTFLVGADGVVYEKDMGKKTETLAKSMKEYDPNNRWVRAEEEQQEASRGEATK